MSRRLSHSGGLAALAAVIASSLTAAFLTVAPAVAAASPAVDAAIAFVGGEQRDDGGFGAGEAGFPGFETPDAVLAIGAAAQSGSSWNAAEALAAVQAVTRAGRTGLSYLDDFADGVHGPLSPGNAARVVIVAASLGLDPGAFDPEGDGSADLVSVMQSGLLPDGSFGAGTMNTTLTAMLAYRAAGLTAPAGSVAYVEAAQQANGSWDYAGDATGEEADPDTTGLALVALVASGLGNDDASVRSGLAFLAGSQNDDGTWSEAFGGESNPSSTALAVLGIRALGFDPVESCWRDTALPGEARAPYGSPIDALIALQAADGHLASPFDQWGVNTLGTTQGVQALARGYLPAVVATPPECPIAPTTTTQAPATTTSSPVGTAGSTTTSSTVTTTPASSTTSTVAAAAATTSTTQWSAVGATLPRTGGGTRRGAALGLTLLFAGLASLTLSTRLGRRARAVAVAVAVTAAFVAVPGWASAGGETHRAAVVVDLGDEVKTARVSFEGDSITGLEALQLAGFDPVARAYGGQGGAVCSICDRGCPADSTCLTCGGASYWAYFRATSGAQAYTYSPVGAGATVVRDGDVEAWKWGPGTAPQYVSFADVWGETTTTASPPSAPPTTRAPTSPATSAPGSGTTTATRGGVPATLASPGPAGDAPAATQESVSAGAQVSPVSPVSAGAAPQDPVGGGSSGETEPGKSVRRSRRGTAASSVPPSRAGRDAPGAARGGVGADAGEGGPEDAADDAEKGGAGFAAGPIAPRVGGATGGSAAGLVGFGAVVAGLAVWIAWSRRVRLAGGRA